MDIFKLFFDHDIRLDKLAKRNANKTKEEVEATLADFMSPTPTFSKFYLTGTRLKEEEFGLDTLTHSTEILQQLHQVFEGQLFYTKSGSFNHLTEALATTAIGQVVIISDSTDEVFPFSDLEVDKESNVGHKKEPLREVLQTGAFVLYKEQAHHGFDLHLFTQKNIYPQLFESFKPLTAEEDFRFFSINSKRMGSERHFYFETWTLNKPPHGAEEVFTGTSL